MLVYTGHILQPEAVHWMTNADAYVISMVDAGRADIQRTYLFFEA